MPKEKPLALDDLVSVRVVRLAEMFSRLAARFFESRYGLRNTELRILVLVGGREALTVNEIARRANIDKAWISRSLRAMADRGLIRRSGHPAKGRQTLISLTAEGEALLADLTPVSLARNARLLEGLDEAEVYRVLDQLSVRAQALLDSPED